jgi:hypothetical protein
MSIRKAPVGARAEKKTTTGIIPTQTNHVNRLRAVRQVSGMSPKQLITEIKKIYPRYDKTLQSKCEHTDDYGVQLAESTLKALEKRFRVKKPKANRAKPYQITVRFEFGEYQLLQFVLGQKGTSTQGFAYDAIMRAINDELEGAQK